MPFELKLKNVSLLDVFSGRSRSWRTRSASSFSRGTWTYGQASHGRGETDAEATETCAGEMESGGGEASVLHEVRSENGDGSESGAGETETCGARHQTLCGAEIVL